MEEFDFNASIISTMQIRGLTDGAYLERAEPVIFLGETGTGKTLSAIHHSRIQKIVPLDRWNAEASDAKPIDTVLFTPEVVNTPARIENDVNRARAVLSSVAKRATRAEQRTTLDALRSRDEAWRVEHREDRDYRPNHPPPLKPTTTRYSTTTKPE
jgi:hypothetical protein